jgi:hypothetical protein
LVWKISSLISDHFSLKKLQINHPVVWLLLSLVTGMIFIPVVLIWSHSVGEWQTAGIQCQW